MSLVAPFFLSSIILFCPSVWAELNFDNISSDSAADIMKDVSAYMTHTTVSPAGSLLRPGGFELGLIAGIASLPHIAKNTSSTETDPVDQLLKVNLVGLYSYSDQITLEANLLPHLHFDDTSVGSQSLAVKYTLHPSEKSPILKQALRVHLTNSYLRSRQNINNESTGNIDVPAKLKFSCIGTGLTYLMSFKVVASDEMILQPYAGVGLLYSLNELLIESSLPASIFTSQSSSEKSNELGTQVLAGVEMHSYFSKFGFEYSRVFESDRFIIKYALGY